MATLNFNAATVQPAEAFDTIPAGWYNVRITESTNKPTKDGRGSYLALTLTVADGKFAKRKLFDRLNINNVNQVAKDIAYQTLSSICHATGVIQCQDSSQLHGILMQAKVTVKPADGQYSESNEIKGYKAVEGGGAVQQAPAWVSQPAPATSGFIAPAAEAPAQAQSGDVPPWAK